LHIVGDVFGLRGGHHQHNNLRAFGFFKRREFVFEGLTLVGVERGGGVDNAGTESRNGLQTRLCPGKTAGQPHAQAQHPKGEPTA